LWTVIEALCLWANLAIALQALQRPLHAIGLLVLGIFVCLFYPVLILFERGQVDTITLLLLTAGFSWIARRQKTFWAGVAFALVALLKLHCVYIFPFLVLRRQWKATGGFVAGGICLILLSSLLNGPASSFDYVRQEIPFISNFGQITVSEEDPFMQKFREVVKGLPAGYTLKDGHRYRGTLILFDENATLVRTRVSSWIKAIARRLFGWELNVSVLSLLYFEIAFSLFFLVGRAGAFSHAGGRCCHGVYLLVDTPGDDPAMRPANLGNELCVAAPIRAGVFAGDIPAGEPGNTG
jgi:Glycosyltransferase family 87